MAKKTKKPKKELTPRQKNIKRGGWGLFAAAFILFLIWGFGGAAYGDMRYAVCNVFAQRQLTFPNTMKVRDYKYIGTRRRIWVTYVDASGQYNYDSFYCEFQSEGFTLSRAMKNRTPYDEEVITGFNKGVQAILSYPPPLKLPYRPDEMSLRDLWQGDEEGI